MKTIIKNNIMSAGISVLVAIFRVIILLWLLYRSTILYYTLFIIYCIVEFVIQFFCGRIFLEHNKLGLVGKCCSCFACIFVNIIILSVNSVSNFSGFCVLEEYFLDEVSRNVNLDIWYIAFCYLAITLGLLSKREKE